MNAFLERWLEAGGGYSVGCTLSAMSVSAISGTSRDRSSMLSAAKVLLWRRCLWVGREATLQITLFTALANDHTSSFNGKTSGLPVLRIPATSCSLRACSDPSIVSLQLSLSAASQTRPICLHPFKCNLWKMERVMVKYLPGYFLAGEPLAGAALVEGENEKQEKKTGCFSQEKLRREETKCPRTPSVSLHPSTLLHQKQQGGVWVKGRGWTTGGKRRAHMHTPQKMVRHTVNTTAPHAGTYGQPVPFKVGGIQSQATHVKGRPPP